MQAADNNKTSDTSARETTPRWIPIVMLTFLAGLVCMAVTLVLDHQNRIVLETAIQNTAAGDTAYYQIEKRPIDRVTQILTFDGQPLYFARLKQASTRDSEMQALGKEDSDRYMIYQPLDPTLRTGPEGQPLYYIKMEPNRYFRLQTYPGAPGMHEVPEDEWMSSSPTEETSPQNE